MQSGQKRYPVPAKRGLASLPQPLPSRGEERGWNEDRGQPETRLPHPRWQIRLLAQASASEFFYSNGLRTQKDRVDPRAREREDCPLRAQLYKRAHSPVDIYALAWPCSGSNQPRIKTKTNNSEMYIWKRGGGSRKRQERSHHSGNCCLTSGVKN